LRIAALENETFISLIGFKKFTRNNGRISAEYIGGLKGGGKGAFTLLFARKGVLAPRERVEIALKLAIYEEK